MWSAEGVGSVGCGREGERGGGRVREEDREIRMMN